MAQKCEWLVILPDRPNALADRMKVRPYVPSISTPFLIPPTPFFFSEIKLID